MKSLVLDCSVTLAWCFEDEQTVATRGILELLRQSLAMVPSIWPIETANVLALAERGGRIDQAHSRQYIETLQALEIQLDSDTPGLAFGEILNLARNHNLTAYDAAYLELAIREGALLATRDAQLQKAAAKVGVELVPTS